MRTFVMGDLHGAFKALVQCMERAGFDYQQDTLVQLGDVADGNNEVYQCVEELLKINNLIAIRGNHDAWFSRFIETGSHPTGWAQGATATAISYLQLTGRQEMVTPTGNTYQTALNPFDIPETHQQFFRRQHLYYIDGNNNCFVHAGFQRDIEFKGQDEAIYYWDRKLWKAALSYKAYNRGNNQDGKFRMATPFTEVFIGHTSTINWNTDQPMKAANIHNLDTGAGHGGRLTIMDVESKEYWQSDPVGELYKNGLD